MGERRGRRAEVYEKSKQTEGKILLKELWEGRKTTTASCTFRPMVMSGGRRSSLVRQAAGSYSSARQEVSNAAALAAECSCSFLSHDLQALQLALGCLVKYCENMEIQWFLSIAWAISTMKPTPAHSLCFSPPMSALLDLGQNKTMHDAPMDASLRTEPIRTPPLDLGAKDS